jgi:hypothetical protein
VRDDRHGASAAHGAVGVGELPVRGGVAASTRHGEEVAARHERGRRMWQRRLDPATGGGGERAGR